MISFVIVNFNLSDELRHCVRGLEAHVECDHEIIVVDNQSTDRQWPACKSYLEGRANTRVLQRADNAGFGRACNEGAGAARGDIVCFLNPDISVHHDFTRRVTDGFARLAGAAVMGIATNRMRWMDFSAGPPPGFLLELLSICLVGRHLEAVWMRLRGALATAPMAVGWVMGACLFIRKDVFMELGGFDPDYFLYFEEVDLCHRVTRAGGRVFYDSETTVDHAGSVSSRRDYAAFTERFYIGKKKFFGKSRGGVQRVLFQWIIQAQIHSQRLLWGAAKIIGSARADDKLRGLHGAARYRVIY